MKAAAGWLIGLGARLHRSVARRLRERRAQPPCAVLSVGGLTMGGAGKTPVAAQLAASLAARGHRVVLASRGYKGRSRQAVTVVSDGVHVLSGLLESGDEPQLLAALAPGVPVLVGRDRRRVGLDAVARFGCEILVLDDGFQHHRLKRDVDFVCVDAETGFGNARVFPAGPLREPLAALVHADWICRVRSGPWPDESESQSELAGLRSSLPAALLESCSWASARRRIRRVRSLSGQHSFSLEELAGRSYGLLAGVGQPDSVRRSVEGLGAQIVVERLFADHHRYREKDLRGLSNESSEWITTEKDALKILPHWTGDARVFVLEMRVEFEDEEALLTRLEAALARPPSSGNARVAANRRSVPG